MVLLDSFWAKKRYSFNFSNSGMMGSFWVSSLDHSKMTGEASSSLCGLETQQTNLIANLKRQYKLLSLIHFSIPRGKQLATEAETGRGEPANVP